LFVSKKLNNEILTTSSDPEVVLVKEILFVPSPAPAYEGPAVLA